jgi:hypothetical protein
MEKLLFANLSRMEICRKMAAICQISADGTTWGIERERLQLASDQFKKEANELALRELQTAV